MKFNFLFTLVFVLNVSGSLLSAQQVSEDLNKEHYCNKARGSHSLFNPMHRSYAMTADYDLKYYRFEWTIDPAVYAIGGQATPYFIPLSDEFNEINFDFSKALTIDSIMWRNKRLAFRQPGAYQLNITFPEKLPSGTLDSITIAYHGVPPSGGFGSFIQSNHKGEPILWTLSEPFGAQDWWPCKNGLDDKIDSIDVIITTQEKYKAASNGSLVSDQTLLNGNKQYHWKHRYAITPYLVAIAVTNYSAYTDDVLLSDGTVMPMLNYVYPEDLTAARKGTADNVKVLQYYDSLFVAYPFKNEKYGHAQFGWGGGMEHQTMSFVINYGWGLLAHELAHQWFGDYVTCGSWEDIWLNEGFATYLEGLSRERYPQTPNDWQNWKSGKISNIVSNTGGSVRVADPTDVNRIFSSRLSYNKGSYLLHMLRWKLGDQLFFSALRQYLTDRAYNYAVTGDLKSHLEAASGQNLEEFFKDWYYNQGYPTYQVGWNQDDQKMLIRLNQTTSHASVDFFEMPVPIKLSGEGKEMKLRLEHVASGQIFDVYPDFKVEKVEFDPELWLIAKSSVSKENFSTSTSDVHNTSWQIYPNPAQHQLVIDQKAGLFTDYRIFDTKGSSIVSGAIVSDRTVIDIQKLANGPYIIRVTGNNTESKKEFVKVD